MAANLDGNLEGRKSEVFQSLTDKSVGNYEFAFGDQSLFKLFRFVNTKREQSFEEGNRGIKSQY